MCTSAPLLRCARLVALGAALAAPVAGLARPGLNLPPPPSPAERMKQPPSVPPSKSPEERLAEAAEAATQALRAAGPGVAAQQLPGHRPPKFILGKDFKLNPEMVGSAAPGADGPRLWRLLNGWRHP